MKSPIPALEVGEMSEMAYEDFPQVEVPRVRDWLSPAFTGMTEALWGRRSSFVVIGWLFFFWAFWQFIKVVIWMVAATGMVIAYGFWAVAELITYRRRLENAKRVAWTQYMLATEIRETP